MVRVTLTRTGKTSWYRKSYLLNFSGDVIINCPTPPPPPAFRDFGPKKSAKRSSFRRKDSFQNGGGDSCGMADGSSNSSRQLLAQFEESVTAFLKIDKEAKLVGEPKLSLLASTTKLSSAGNKLSTDLKLPTDVKLKPSEHSSIDVSTLKKKKVCNLYN